MATCAFYTSPQGCRVRNCPFLHDPTAGPDPRLHPCPSPGCQNMCLGRQCGSCHRRMRSFEEKRKRAPQAFPVHACPEPGCRNTCMGVRCRECHLLNLSSSQAAPELELDPYASDEGGFHDRRTSLMVSGAVFYV